MKAITCRSCGSNDIYVEGDYYICKYCGTRFLLTSDDKPAKESTIDLNNDVERLLQRCKEEPARAKKCAERILETTRCQEASEEYCMPIKQILNLIPGTKKK